AKGSNVKAGGAGGLVLINVDGGSETVDNDFHVLPSIHLDATKGQSLVNWLAHENHYLPFHCHHRH
ncbi:MAG: PA domain-containing protein, partial [Pseudomonadota bacterium]